MAKSKSIKDLTKNKLTIELVPSSLWFSSVYQICKKANPVIWQEIKKALLEKEGNQCFICGKKNTKLEAHEFWSYDDINHIQKLEAIHHVCSLCHKVKHLGLAAAQKDDMEEIIKHFCKVNKCKRKDFEKAEKEAYEIWRERSKYSWEQDFGDYGFVKKLFYNPDEET